MFTFLLHLLLIIINVASILIARIRLKIYYNSPSVYCIASDNLVAISSNKVVPFHQIINKQYYAVGLPAWHTLIILTELRRRVGVP